MTYGDDTMTGRQTVPAADQPDRQGTEQGMGSTIVDALLVVRFAIRGLLRFLSHAETLRVFQRACARANLPVKYSQGFNPHPRLSLPLPRTVGVESEDEMLALRLFDEKGFAVSAVEDRQNRMKAALAAQLPQDIGLRDVTLMKTSTSVHPESAEYLFSLVEEVASRKGGQVRACAEHFLARETAVMERAIPDQRQSRRVDVRPFVQRIQFEGADVIVTCGVSNAGSIRVEELLGLLDLTPEDLAGPIRRRHVTWRIENQ